MMTPDTIRTHTSTRRFVRTLRHLTDEEVVALVRAIEPDLAGKLAAADQELHRRAMRTFLAGRRVQ